MRTCARICEESSLNTCYGEIKWRRDIKMDYPRSLQRRFQCLRVTIPTPSKRNRSKSPPLFHPNWINVKNSSNGHITTATPGPKPICTLATQRKSPTICALKPIISWNTKTIFVALLLPLHSIDTAAFHLDEFGYASLFPPILLQDTLSRVHNYLVYSKYNKPLERKSAAARIQTHYREFFIEKEQFIIGGISSLTFSDLQKLNPVVEEFSSLDDVLFVVCWLI